MSHCTTQKRTGLELPTLAPTAFDDLLACRRGGVRVAGLIPRTGIDAVVSNGATGSQVPGAVVTRCYNFRMSVFHTDDDQ